MQHDCHRESSIYDLYDIVNNSSQMSFSKDPTWEVESIRERRELNGRTEYLLKWVDYPESANTWVQENLLENCEAKIQQFLKHLNPSKNLKDGPELAEPLKFIAHKNKSDGLYFDLLYADESTTSIPAGDATQKYCASLIDYIESITAALRED
jgi:hypothetical protein